VGFVVWRIAEGPRVFFIFLLFCEEPICKSHVVCILVERTYIYLGLYTISLT